MEFKPGRDNIVADALSRSCYLTISPFQSSLVHQIQQLQLQDQFCVNILTAIQQGTTYATKFTMKHQLLFYEDKIVVPADSEIKK